MALTQEAVDWHTTFGVGDFVVDNTVGNIIAVFCYDLCILLNKTFESEDDAMSNRNSVFHHLKQLMTFYENVALVLKRDMGELLHYFRLSLVIYGVVANNITVHRYKLINSADGSIIDYENVLRHIRSGDLDEAIRMLSVGSRSTVNTPVTSFLFKKSAVLSFPDKQLFDVWDFIVENTEITNRLRNLELIVSELNDVIEFANYDREIAMFLLALYELCQEDKLIVKSPFFEFKLDMSRSLFDVVNELYKTCMSMAGCWRVHLKECNAKIDTLHTCKIIPPTYYFKDKSVWAFHDYSQYCDDKPQELDEKDLSRLLIGSQQYCRFNPRSFVNIWDLYKCFNANFTLVYTYVLQSLPALSNKIDNLDMRISHEIRLSLLATRTKEGWPRHSVIVNMDNNAVEKGHTSDPATSDSNVAGNEPLAKGEKGGGGRVQVVHTDTKGKILRVKGLSPRSPSLTKLDNIHEVTTSTALSLFCWFKIIYISIVLISFTILAFLTAKATYVIGQRKELSI